MRAGMEDAVKEIQASTADAVDDFESAWDDATQAFKEAPSGVLATILVTSIATRLKRAHPRKIFD